MLKFQQMNPTKRVANSPPPVSSRSSRLEQYGANWQPALHLSCRFQGLPEGIVMYILSRLSVKTLFKCRSVCTSWLRIISDPQFVHLHRSTSPVGILTKSQSMEVDFIQIEECDGSDFRVENMWFTPKNNLPTNEYNWINSCDGLLCLSGTRSMQDTLYVCNPLLGEYSTIAPPTVKVESFRAKRFRGIGFSVRTNEYKVLRTFATLIESRRYIQAEIYTIGTEAWRSIGEAPGDFDVYLHCDTFLRGALHWVTRSSNISQVLYSFNFDIEQFRPIPPPSCLGPKEKESPLCLKLGVVGGCLLLCAFNFDDDSRKFDMWVMKHYGVQDSWTKIFVMENPRICSQRQWDSSEPLVFLKNGEILMLYNYHDVVCYNRETKSYRRIEFTRTRAPLGAIAYSPSFVSLYDRGEEVKRVRGSKKSRKLLGEGCCHCAGSAMQPHKSSSNSYADLTLRTVTACSICGTHLGYVFRGKGSPMCQRCYEHASSC